MPEILSWRSVGLCYLGFRLRRLCGKEYVSSASGVSFVVSESCKSVCLMASSTSTGCLVKADSCY